MPDEGSSQESYPILDNSRLAEIADGDMDFQIELLGDYLSNLSELYDQLKAYSNLQELDNIRKAAHSIAGSSANIGAARLAQAAREIDAAVRASDLETALKHVQEIDSVVYDTREAISGFINNGKS